MNAAQEKGTVGAVVDNSNDASTASANSIYDFSKLKMKRRTSTIQIGTQLIETGN